MMNKNTTKNSSRHSSGRRWRYKSRSTIVTVPDEKDISTHSIIRKKSNMKIVTLDESLHSTYGREQSGSSEDTKSTAATTVPNRGVQWKDIQIREYNRIVGDNPSCSSGPPVSIGWQCNGPVVMTVDDYENSRPPRRSSTEMLLPRSVRQDMLMSEWGVPRSSIASAVRNNIKIKNQRRRTVTNLNESTEKMEAAMESAGRKLKRVLFFRKHPSKEMRKMQEEAARAAAMIERISEEESYYEDSEGEVEEADNDLSEVPEADKASGEGSETPSEEEKSEEQFIEDIDLPAKKSTPSTDSTYIDDGNSDSSGNSVPRPGCRPCIVITEDD